MSEPEIEQHKDTPPSHRRKRVAYNRDWTQGSIIGNLWSLSWPMTISTAIRMLGPTIDMIWVGKLGTAALAGVGVSGIAVQVINSARMGLNTGTRAMLARFVGAGDTEGANHVAQQAFVISIVFSLFTAVIGIAMAEPILIFLGVKPDVVKEGAAYMHIMFGGSIAMSLGMMAQGIMQASGDAVHPMQINLGIRFFHVLFCPFLVFGWWIFPSMGVQGAAMTNVVSQGIGAVLMFWILFTGRTRLKLSLRHFSFDSNILWRIVKIGIPSSITGMERSMANFFLVWFVVPFGTAALAAHSLADRCGNFLRMPASGFGQASGVLAGQNLGAGQPDRAEKTGWLAAGLFTAVMVIIAMGIWFFAEYVVRIFNSEPKLLKIGGTFLRIDIVNYLAFGLVVVLMNCLNGMGDTLIPMLTTLTTMWLVQVPMAYILSKLTPLGVYGVRWGFVSAIVMRAVIYTLYFKHGRWRRKQV
jgi:putative MATE family efflux protein